MGVTNLWYIKPIVVNTQDMIKLFVLLSFLLSCMIARIIIPKITLISEKKKLFDLPDERKVHTGAVPRLGGVSFFPTIMFSVSFTLALRYVFDYYIPGKIADHVVPEFLFLTCGLTLLYLIGTADDLIGVRYKKKFWVQILASLFFPISGVYINEFYGLFGIHAVPAAIGIPLTILLVVFITNAINLIDGLDGLASSLSSVALVTLGCLFLQKGLLCYAILAFAVFGVLLPFFYYNVFGRAENGTKIFMGDTGSLTLGYILSFLTIKYAMNTDEISLVRDGALLIAFSTLIVPMLDVIRVVLLRLRQHKSPFQPDKNHIHHKFLAMGVTHRKTMLSILGIACLFALVNIWLQPYVDINILFVGDIVVWTVMNVVFDRVRDNYQTRINNIQI